MISAVFTARRSTFAKILTLLVAALIVRVAIADEIFPFDFDQVKPAEAAYAFFVNHKLSLIGQELSFPGFFLGPLHFWIQFIPYGFCRLMPDCVPFFYILVSTFVILAAYIVTKKIAGHNVAIVVAIIKAFAFAAISAEIGTSSNYFLYLSSLGLLFCLHQYFLGKNIFLPIGAFISGLATVNFNPVFVFSSIAFFVISSLRTPRAIKWYLLAVFAFLANILPLALFNFRHDNILIASLANFAAQNSSSLPDVGKPIYIIKHISIPFYTNYLFQSNHYFATAVTLILLLLGIAYSVKKGQKLLVAMPIWIVIVTIGFTFYSGHIPDYYLEQTLLPFSILAAYVLAKKRLLLYAFLLIFLFINIARIAKYDSAVNYQIKKSVVNYVISNTSGETFNIYYDFPPGLNTGYDYLFKARGIMPQEGGTNLYILEFEDPALFDVLKYKRSFVEKDVNSISIGFVNVVSVR
ncbi:hypothetical protein HYZ70_01475 [Candidatus Curtissbacteria bacterium]|nr:hypothetical protein [Candidatus Curtissbacteria bacterium]